MRVGYLVNQYPKISHTFIRVEIAGLERAGTEVVRFSIRPTPDRLIDPDDQREAERTRVLFEAPLWQLFGALVRSMLRPLRLLRAIRMAGRMGRISDRGIVRHYAYLLEACLLKAWAAEAGVGHIHAHFGTNPAAVAMLCNALGGPGYSFTVHGPEEFDKASQISLPEKIRRARFVAAVSDFGRSQLWRYCRAAEWDKIRVVRCGVDSRFIEQTCDSPSEAPSLVCVGRLCEQKGQLLLLKAAAALRDGGLNFRLSLVGDGELRTDIEAAIAANSLQDHVFITGWQPGEQVRRQISDSRALVLPSFAEGLPVVIMEALALCRPVISTYVAGIPELVSNGSNGWLVPAGATAPLVAAMRDALSLPPAELFAMGRRGRDRVRQSHDAGRNAAALGMLLRETR